MSLLDSRQELDQSAPLTTHPASPRGLAKGTVLITGAASGMGRELTRRLQAQGRVVAGVDQDESGLKQLEAELPQNGGRFAWRSANVADAEQLALQVARLSEELGPVDLAIAAAGIAEDTPANALDAATVARTIDVNLIGVANTIAAVLPGMLTRRRGHIVAISSLASYCGQPGMMAYCASKAGINALMESLRLDVKHCGIFTTTICPGYTRTPQAVGQYKSEFMMPVEEAADEILWAISRHKRWHAFPRTAAFQLHLLKLLPASLRDWFLLRNMEQVKK